MNAPYTETTRAKSTGRSTGRVCTQHRDRNDRMIYTGDLVRDAEGFIGIVLFINGAYRVDVTHDQSGHYLRFNSSLLFKEGVGTGGWVIVR